MKDSKVNKDIHGESSQGKQKEGMKRHKRDFYWFNIKAGKELKGSMQG